MMKSDYLFYDKKDESGLDFLFNTGLVALGLVLFFGVIIPWMFKFI